MSGQEMSKSSIYVFITSIDIPSSDQALIATLKGGTDYKDSTDLSPAMLILISGCLACAYSRSRRLASQAIQSLTAQYLV
jgi:hypothetical protein